MSANPEHIMVIGAGIVGVSTAIWLQRAGHRVTLLDREGPAAGASFGNAGILAACAIVPVTVPGLIWKAPKMLFSRDQPLFLKWRYLPRLVPFLLKYLANTNARSVDRASQALSQLLHDSPEQHVALAKGTPAENYITTDDYLFGYKDKTEFEADSFVWNLRKNFGVKYTEMKAEALAEFDPSLKGRFGYGVHCPYHGHISDPGAYVEALAGHFEASGGEVLQAELSGFDISAGRCCGIETNTGTLKADTYILATGAWSGPLANALGITVPLESERGYHVEFTNPSITLRAPIMVAAGKFVATPMEGRLRCAGVVEFGGLDLPASKAPAEFLKRSIAKLFPDLTYDGVEEWMGHRPATADSIPVIGKSPKAENVLVGYGHHHIGLTGGPKTGRWLAQLASGQPTNADLSAYAPGR
ncbi:MAG: FAD-binding oxidoreductase [Rhodobacteraceae bacterium]|nr:FAD-binding oxidoreductase [Paracoccaceae bacterium]